MKIILFLVLSLLHNSYCKDDDKSTEEYDAVAAVYLKGVKNEKATDLTDEDEKPVDLKGEDDEEPVDLKGEDDEEPVDLKDEDDEEPEDLKGEEDEEPVDLKGEDDEEPEDLKGEEDEEPEDLKGEEDEEPEDLKGEEDEEPVDLKDEDDEEPVDLKDEDDEEPADLKGDDDEEKEVFHNFPIGEVTDIFGANQHYNIPANYQDLGRRFILQYPYTKKKTVDELAEEELHKAVEQYIEDNQNAPDLRPVKAPPKFVLDIAKKSAILEKSKPKNPSDDFIQKDILRTGNYWNDVWVEKINPKTLLRSTNPVDPETIKVEIKPGSKLYTLLSVLKEKSPRLLYVINKSD